MSHDHSHEPVTTAGEPPAAARVRALADLLVEKETIEGEEFESLFEGILPPRSGPPTPTKIGAIAPETVSTDEVEPESDEGGTRRRPGPAPQPA